MLAKDELFSFCCLPLQGGEKDIAIGVVLPTHIFFLTAKHIASGTIRKFFFVWALRHLDI